MKISLPLCVSALALMPGMALAESADNETIIVTARPNPEDPPVVAAARDDLSRTPGAVSVVANESYETRAATGLTDLLRDVPGVLAQRRYGEESRFSIRGSGLDQSYHQRGVLFAQDGVPFADADGFSDFQKLDPLTARYAEVYRGGNALRFGGAQLGGAVNLVTPTGRTAQSENLLRAEAGSFGFARASGQIARTWGDWDAFAALTAMQGDGYREHAQQDQLRGTFNLGRSFGEDREVRLIVYGADINQDVPGTLTLVQALTNPEAASGAAAAFDWQRDQEVFRTSLQTRWRFNDALLFEGGLYATTTDLYHPISLLIDQQIVTQGVFGRFDWQGEIAGRRADLYWGASYRQGHVDQILGPVMFPIAGDSRREATGMELFAEGRLFVTDALALVAGGSYGRFTRDYDDRLNAANNDSLDDGWFAPRIGLLWEGESGVQVYANITNSVEPPHYGALVQAPYPGFVPVEPQEAWTGEIGTRGRTDAFVWDITLYRAELENELLSFNPATGVPAAFFNADETVHQGIEFALDWEIAADWVLRQSYTYSDFFFDGDPIYGDNQIPVAPEHQYRATLRYTHPAGWFVAPSVEWRPSDTWVDYANTLQAPGYTIWSLNAGWDFDTGVTLFIDARNLTDEAYVPEFGAIVDASAIGANTAVFYPGEGRAAYGGVSYRF
ncbi:TonB-dependent receptor family protein [Vitreimonas flagellata]|uniref:TonB-dependent receptor family protein n=1 Tax=Vitreimonas flagellata TaxID=2560861 RepID=UPI001074F8F6|nr:TonB-dependent receptor [Vitreimonas flagellata]